MAISKPLTARQQQILTFIEAITNQRGYPPSVREIGDEVGLSSPSTVHSHLNTLQRLGYLRRDPTKPRAIEVRYDPTSGASDLDRRLRLDFEQPDGGALRGARADIDGDAAVRRRGCHIKLHRTRMR